MFLSSGASNGTNVTLQVTSIFTNPVSTETVSSFSLATYTSSGYMIDQLTSSLSVTMVTPADFTSISITPTSNLNSALTNYTFQLAQPSEFASGSKLDILFPSDIVPQANATCTDLLASSLASSLACTISGQTVTVNLAGNVNNSSFGVIISTAKNAPSLKPTGKFGFATRTASGLGYYSQNLTTVAVANTVPSSFPTLSAIFSPQTLNSALSSTITFSPTSSITGYVVLSLASSFTASSLSCNVAFAGTCTLGSSTFNISGTFSMSSMSFSVAGFSSPKTIPSDYSVITSYDSSNYIIDQSISTLIFTLNCTLPCKTCSVLTNNCTSCYDVSITSSIYFNPITYKCVDTCEAGYFTNVPLGKCSQCSSNCLTCTSTATNCSSCYANTGFPYLNITTNGTATCLANCVSGMYPDTNQNPTLCVACVSPCITCTTQTACLSCANGSYLYLTSCLPSCPPNVSIANSITNVCQPCDSVCATCSTMVSNCTSCANGTAYYNFNCVSTCPSGMVIKNGLCASCDSPCLSCSLTSTNCTSCDPATSTPHYLNYACMTVCPSTFYNESATGDCLACGSLFINCQLCLNKSACISCDIGFVYLNFQCLSTTPPGYVNISGIAQKCTGDCGTCSVIQSNCTSCLTMNLLGNQCTATCPTTYAPINSVCTLCASPCLTCSQTITNCTSCSTSLTPAVYLSNSQCIIICPSGTYANTTDYVCYQCISPCQTCISLTQCQTCAASYSIYQSSCLSECPAGYTAIASQCIICQSPCRTCSTSTTTCTSCLDTLTPELFLAGTACVEASNCPTLTYANLTNNQCTSCTLPCQTCTSSTACMSCLIDYNLEGTVCKSNCLSGSTPINSVCTVCTQPCSTCAGTITTCLSCNQTSTTYYLYNNYCITSCPDTKYDNAATYECLPCVSPCATCIS
jgi:hypothetical protein